MRFNFAEGRIVVTRNAEEQLGIEIKMKGLALELQLRYWDAATLHVALGKALHPPAPSGECGFIKCGDEETRLGESLTKKAGK